MRRISLLIAIFALAALAAAPGASASCASGFAFGGAFYTPATVQSDLRMGQAVPGGILPGCDDVIVIGPSGERINPVPPDVPIELRAIAGVPTVLALARPGEPRSAYLAPGSLPQLPSHPLHRAIYGRRHPVSARRADCLAPRTVTAVVGGAQTGIGPLAVQTRGGRTIGVAVERGTRVRGARRAGRHPYLRAGDRVTITGPRCGTGWSSVLVADRIRVIR